MVLGRTYCVELIGHLQQLLVHLQANLFALEYGRTNFSIQKWSGCPFKLKLPKSNTKPLDFEVGDNIFQGCQDETLVSPHRLYYPFSSIQSVTMSYLQTAQSFIFCSRNWGFPPITHLYSSYFLIQPRRRPALSFQSSSSRELHPNSTWWIALCADIVLG